MCEEKNSGFRIPPGIGKRRISGMRDLQRIWRTAIPPSFTRLIHIKPLFYVYNFLWRSIPMQRTNIEIDEALVKEAMELTKQKTKKAVVNFALKELVNKEKRKKLLEFEGKVEWRGNLAEMRTGRT